jgi:hypothetical protein
MRGGVLQNDLNIINIVLNALFSSLPPTCGGHTRDATADTPGPHESPRRAERSRAADAPSHLSEPRASPEPGRRPARGPAPARPRDDQSIASHLVASLWVGRGREAAWARGRCHLPCTRAGPRVRLQVVHTATDQQGRGASPRGMSGECVRSLTLRRSVQRAVANR